MVRIKKALALLLSAAMACGVLALSGCASPEEREAQEAVRAILTADLDSIKTLDESFAQAVEADPGFAENGVDGMAFMGSLLGGFDYEIEDIEVDVEGGTAEVTVTFTCKSMGAYQEAMQQLAVERLGQAEMATMAEDELAAFAAEHAIEVMDSVPTTETEPFIILFEQVDGAWRQSAESEDAITAAMMA